MMPNILYFDSDIIVCNKQPNIQSAPGYNATLTSLAASVSELFNIPRIDHMIVHRLDYATSGISIAMHLHAYISLLLLLLLLVSYIH